MSFAGSYQYTPLHNWHHSHGAKMAPFAGYDMPIQYPTGILQEHKHVRQKAGVFDVSHMGQVDLIGPQAISLLEKMTPSDIAAMPIGQSKYTVLMNAQGGIQDDIILTRRGADSFRMVLNAGRKQADLAILTQMRQVGTALNNAPAEGLIALQGPMAQEVMATLSPPQEVLDLPFMHALFDVEIAGVVCDVFRCGYTGEDGFEISTPTNQTATVWKELVHHSSVEPIGLGARDTLRLEAGLPLYEQDISMETSPVEAALTWIIRPDGKPFLGSQRVYTEIQQGVKHQRIGILVSGKGGMARADVPIMYHGDTVGKMTSGGFSPILNTSIGQAYLPPELCIPGTNVHLDVRGRLIPACIHELNFLKSLKENQ